MNQESVIERFEEIYEDITLLEFSNLERMFKEEFGKIDDPILKRRWKRFIFNFKMAEYKREKIWEYLNDDIGEEYFNHFVEGVHKGWFK